MGSNRPIHHERRKEGIEIKDSYVALYLVDKAYGGAAEGGWWYEYGEVKECFPCATAGEMAFVMEKLQAYADLQNAYRNDDIGSTGRDGRYEVMTTDRPAENFPSEKPHYE